MNTFSGRSPSQRADELLPFVELLKANDVRSYLEIGSRHGDTFHAVMSALPVDCFGVAVDLPGGAWGHQSSQDALETAVRDLRANGRRCEVIYGDSTDENIVRSIRGMGRFDAILIDGDHRLAGVTADWANYGPLANIVAFHDVAGRGIVQRTTGLPVEVPQLWDELRSSCRTIAFIGEGSKMGIGVVLQ